MAAATALRSLGRPLLAPSHRPQQLGQHRIGGGLAAQALGKGRAEGLLLGHRFFAKEAAVEEGVLGQKALAEAVDGGDGGAVEAEQRAARGGRGPGRR